jgi:hypothetical protein
VEKEQDQLARALARPASKGLAEVHWAPSATWAELQDLLLEDEWHVLHFIGHGDFDLDRDEGVLALVRENGRADLVAAHRLVDLLRQARPMPRLVVLNSCSGAVEGVSDLFSGTAAALVRGGVSAVAAMQYEISDPAAVAFARGFYAALVRGRGVDDAVSNGRVAILGLSDLTLEWVTPVLYLRGHDSQLFTLPAPSDRTVLEGTGSHDIGSRSRDQPDDTSGTVPHAIVPAPQAPPAPNRIIITLTQGSLNNSYINLVHHLGFFPADAVGAANARDGVGAMLKVHFDGLPDPVETDIAGAPHKDFRRRAPIRQFFTHHNLKAGDKIAIEKLSDYEYRVLPVR